MTDENIEIELDAKDSTYFRFLLYLGYTPEIIVHCAVRDYIENEYKRHFCNL